MPLPLAPLIPLALRAGVFAAAVLALRRAVAARTHPGRTDQRAEDALDDLGEGFSLHRPADRASTEPAPAAPASDGQTNATARLRRSIRFGGYRYDLDAGLMARFRLRKTRLDPARIDADPIDAGQNNAGPSDTPRSGTKGQP